jgi:STE24 endopeptidase
VSRKSLWLIALFVAVFAAGHWVAFAADPAGSVSVVPVAVPDPSPEDIRHYQSGIALWIVSNIWAFVVPALIFFTGFSSRLRDTARRFARGWFASLLIYVVLFLLVVFLANLPLDYYSDFLRPHDYGLSSQAFAKWLQDEFVSLGLTLLGGALFLWIPFLLLQRAPKRWWLYTWFASIPIVVFIGFIEPVWIEPLFNDFGPVHDKALETRILKLAGRAGIEGANVYEVNKSVDTKQLNAYVTGIGSSKRIVLWDTTLKEFDPDEVALVMSHEMGHYALGHVWKGLIYECAGLFFGFWLVHVSVGWILRRCRARSRVDDPGDIASLPLFILLFSAAAFVLTPPLLAVSRHYEHEADRFALEMTHQNHGCAIVFVKFIEHDLSYPSPSRLMQFFRGSHPSAAERINFCNTYHPWLEGQEGRYSSYFKPLAGD